MRTVQLGNTGVEVSALCLGVMNFGTKEDEATSYALLDQYVEAGGSFMDTANIYAHWQPGGKGGDSEKLLGRWMKERGNRGDLFIASKVGFPYADVEQGLEGDKIIAECEKSLERMDIDTIDLYYAHVDDRNTPMEETLEAFDKLVRDGKVRFIGASNFLAWRLERARWISKTNDLAAYCCIQQRFTYARPRPGADFAPQVSANDDLLDYCASNPVTMLAYSPLLGGAYTRDDRDFAAQYQSHDTQARVKVLKTIAEEVGATPNQVIYAWMLQSTPLVIPLTAASTKEQLAENLGALDVTLSNEQIQRLNEAGHK
jgi:aryl-alcohol dehydrogenase-like predicted oxidoreductase